MMLQARRHHIRAYRSDADDWTAIQVHEEYFDWFRLRHTVTDIHGPARVIEDDFIDQPFVEDVSRTHYGLSGGWSDGWISSIELAIIGLLSTVVARDTRTALSRFGRDIGQWAVTNRHGFLLAAALAGLLLGVRAAGIGLVLALGLLAVAVVNSHSSERFGPDGEVDAPDPPLILLAGAGWLVGLGLPLFGYL